MVGARDLLERLQAQGTPIGLVSNSPLPFVLRSLEIVGFEAIFDAIVSGHEVEAQNPPPDPYLEGCRRLGVEPGPGVIALEDSPTGVTAARTAGHRRDRRPLDRRRRAGRGPPHRRAWLRDATVVELTIV